MDISPNKPPFDVKESVTRGGTVFELLEYHELQGDGSPGSATQLYGLNRSGARLRQLRIRLNNDAVRTEPGALQFLRGKIEMQSDTGAGGGVGGLLVVALSIPLAPQEILPIELDNETLQVDGSFALLRTGEVRFTVEKASNSYIGAVTSGEGLLQTFRGTGTVWLAPTLPAYAKMLAPAAVIARK